MERKEMKIIHLLVNLDLSTREKTREQTEPYLYSNFKFSDIQNAADMDFYPVIVIEGEDSSGWTAEAQVARLHSGGYGAKVIN